MNVSFNLNFMRHKYINRELLLQLPRVRNVSHVCCELISITVDSSYLSVCNPIY